MCMIYKIKIPDNANPFDIIDIFLNTLNDNNRFYVANFYKSENTNHLKAINYMEEYGLVRFPVNILAGNSELLPKGIDLVSLGIGSEKYIGDIESEKILKNNLEFKKLKGDVELLRYSIKNAKDLPWQFWITLALSVFAILISILAYCKKS